MGTCQRYSKAEKKYIQVPQPSVNKEYNRNMGSVDLLDSSEKNYAITTRVRKWYWAIYTWFLNVCMVQAWRLYRAHMAERHRLAAVNPRESEADKKKRRAEEKKKEEMPLLEFMRQVVDLLFRKHMDPNRSAGTKTSTLRAPSRAEILNDNSKHLVRLTDTKGVCKQCKNRTRYRCMKCNAAFHPEECFFLYHSN